MIEWEKTETGKCERLLDVPNGASVVRIDGKDVVGFCEGCAAPDFGDVGFMYDFDGTAFCPNCAIGIVVEKCCKCGKSIFVEEGFCPPHLCIDCEDSES